MKSIDWSEKILLNITTSPDFSFEYKIKEADRMGIRTVACFPEFIALRERKKLYSALEKSKIQHIPHVHIRDQDFECWELDMFMDKYQTRYFNVHENFLTNLARWSKKYLSYFYVEFNYNNRVPKLLESNMHLLGGLCLDFSHLWSAKNRQVLEWDVVNNLIKKYPVGCNHLNGYSARFKRDLHYLKSYQQLDYLKEIPLKYFGRYISLEMNNSLASQQKYKKYIIEILKKKNLN